MARPVAAQNQSRIAEITVDVRSQFLLFDNRVNKRDLTVGVFREFPAQRTGKLLAGPLVLAGKQSPEETAPLGVKSLS